MAESAEVRLDDLLPEFLAWIQPCVHLMDGYLRGGDDRYRGLIEWIAAQARDPAFVSVDRYLRITSSMLATGVELILHDEEGTTKASRASDVEEAAPSDPGSLLSLVMSCLARPCSADRGPRCGHSARSRSTRSLKPSPKSLTMKRVLHRERHLALVVWNLAWIAASGPASS